MIALTLGELARITGGTLTGPRISGAADPAAVVIDGPVVTDSREAGPGSLYVARIGASADGHDFIDAAARRGAVAALTTRGTGRLPQVVVPDEQAAFVALARHLVDQRSGLNVIGITGSSGKTSTKDLLGQVLATDGETVAPIGSYNSEVGVPLTVCRITETTRHLVVEMGARAIGHVRYLTEIAPPRIGIVLNIGSAHLGEFGSREQIAVAKSELVQALPPDGVAVLNADDPLVRAMAQRTSARVVLVGESPDAQLRAHEIEIGSDGRASFTLTGLPGPARVRLAVAGRHQVGNALAVIAAAHESGLALEPIVAALASAGPVSRYRMEVSERADGTVLINDAYNANPESMSAALEALATMAGTRRKVAILGPMLELGPQAPAAHRAVGRESVEHGVGTLLVVGDLAAEIGAGALAVDASVTVRYASDVETAYAVAGAIIRPGDIVLLKSSNGAGLRFLGDRLRDASPAEEE